MFQSLATGAGFIWLDSSSNVNPYGRWSYMMTEPFMTISGGGNVYRLKQGGNETTHEGDPLPLLDELLRRFRTETSTGAIPPFTGGAAGFLGYGLLRFTEPSAQLPRGTRIASEGDLWLGFYDRIIAFDHECNETWLIANHDTGSDPAQLLDDLERSVDEAVRRSGADALANPPIQRKMKVESSFMKESYATAVEKVRLYIERGDILQANISRKIAAHGSFDPVALYLRLRAVNPAPFAAYVNGGSFRLLSSSPERFMQLKDGQAQTRPIKGTRPRGQNAEDDDRLRHDLAVSGKDRAENVMIVDLMRNDLSKVCQPFTVNVPELCGVERFATVFHLTSTVEGKLKAGLTAVDLIRASFPPGSVTGAPKLRALEIIDEVEPDPRGAYCGSIGWIGFGGAMDTSVAIRMMVHTDDGVRLHSGGGVTYPSRPEDEYDETSVKASALLEALLKS